MAVTVTALHLAPVKGLRVCAVDAVELTPTGAAGDRAFVVIGEDDARVGGSRHPELLAVQARWDGARGLLRLRFPNGEEVEAAPEPGAAGSTPLYDGRELRGRRVEGPLADALSAYLGRRVRLLARDGDEQGADDFPVTLMSEASRLALGAELADGAPDARRFRMTLTVDGVAAWEEHGWAGRELAAGEAVLRVADPVPRCVVTTRDPDTGRTDAPVLKALARLRGKDDVTFGIWCEVVAPGTVRRGDTVAPA